MLKSPSNTDSFSRRAQRFWQQRQRRAGALGYSGYLLDESPQAIGQQRFRGEWRDLQAWLRRRPVARGRCLDLGCGTGVWLQALAGEFQEAEGWDYAPAMVTASRQRLKRAGIRNAKVRLGSLSTRKGKAVFDLIFVGGVLMYTPDAQLKPLLLSLRRLLKPGGALLLRETTLASGTWSRQGLPLRPGLLAQPHATDPDADYVAIYRSPAALQLALRAAGLQVLAQRPNRHYKLSDLTEDWLRRLDFLVSGRLRGNAAWAERAAAWIHGARWLLLYPEYFLRPWKLQNHWFYCVQDPRRSSTWNER